MNVAKHSVSVAYGLHHSIVIDCDPVISGIAQKLNKSPNEVCQSLLPVQLYNCTVSYKHATFIVLLRIQVVTRWCTQRGVVAISRSQDAAHQTQNLNTLAFTLGTVPPRHSYDSWRC